MTGSGKGGAAASIFTLLHSAEILSWPLPSSSTEDSKKFVATPRQSPYPLATTESPFEEESITHAINLTLNESQKIQPTEQDKLDVRCITFNCPKFIHQDDLSLVSPTISSRLVHLYGEHEMIPLSLTSLSQKFARSGLIVPVKGKRLGKKRTGRIWR
jgi:hypothetical protein